MCVFFYIPLLFIVSISVQVLFFKGLMSPVEYFLCSCAHFYFFIFSLSNSTEKINMKFLLASFKTMTNSKNYSVSRIKFLFQLSFALIG
jgi:hypothetical protein